MKRVLTGSFLMVLLIAFATGCAGPRGQNMTLGALLGAGIGLAAGGGKGALVGGLIGAAAGGAADAVNNNGVPPPQVTVVGQAPSYEYEEAYVEQPVITEEVLVPPIIVGEPYYYAPPVAVTYPYDYFTYEYVGGWTNVVFWRGGHRFRSEVWRDRRGRMSVGRAHEWSRSHRIHSSQLRHHRQLLERNHRINHPDSHFGTRHDPRRHDIRNDRDHGRRNDRDFRRQNLPPNGPRNDHHMRRPDFPSNGPQNHRYINRQNVPPNGPPIGQRIHRQGPPQSSPRNDHHMRRPNLPPNGPPSRQPATEQRGQRSQERQMHRPMPQDRPAPQGHPQQQRQAPHEKDGRNRN